MGNLTERDYRSYRAGLRPGRRRPAAAGPAAEDLRTPVPVLIERIHGRGRSMESGITADYLSLLETFYDEWLKTFDLCPVLTIQTDDLDFVHKPQHMDIVGERIQDRLAGKEDYCVSREPV